MSRSALTNTALFASKKR